MENLRRSLMILKPGDSRLIEPGKSGGTLKLQSKEDGVELSLKTDCLKSGDYFLYFFLTNGKELFAGDVRDGFLNTFVPGVTLEHIAGAAVVHRENGNHTFCLKSTGPDWPSLIERFKMRRTQHRPQSYIPAPPPPRTTPDVCAPASAPRPEPVFYAPESSPYTPQEEHEAPERSPQTGGPPSKENINDIDIQDMPDAEESYENKETGFEEEGCDACPHAVRENKVNPFPSFFPNSEWVKISYPGPTGWWHYISGKIYKGGVLAAKALGVPGEYGMAPPIWLEGFGTYLRCVTGDARGYWLMFQDAETGEVLDMGLSQHGA